MFELTQTLEMSLTTLLVDTEEMAMLTESKTKPNKVLVIQISPKIQRNPKNDKE